MTTNALATQGFKIEISDSGIDPLVYTEIKEIKNFSGFDGSAAVLDATHLQSTAKEKRKGLKDLGGFSIDVNHLPSDAGQKKLRDAIDLTGDTAEKTFLLTLSDTSTVQFNAFVMSNSQSGGVDAIHEGSFTLEITGDLTVTEAA